MTVTNRYGHFGVMRHDNSESNFKERVYVSYSCLDGNFIPHSRNLCL